MDFSKFLDSNFDVKDWVNEAFKSKQDEKSSSDTQNKKDVYAATLVTKLQVFIQEVNKSLEDMSQQVITSMPRVLRDIEALKQECSYLREQMRQVKDEIQDVEQRTSHSMEVLVLVDNVRTNVEIACSALKEADNWSSLAAAIEDVFQAGDIAAIAEKLKSMQNSLLILKDSPDYEDKQMHLEALKNRLETIVSPSVVSAFVQHNTEEAKKLHDLFVVINRVPEFHSYYIKTYGSNLISQWQEAVTNSDENAGATPLKDVYELLLATWQAQLPWCISVFGDAKGGKILLQLLTQIMMSAQPSFVDIVTSSIQNADESKIIHLIKLHERTFNFNSNLLASVQTQTKHLESESKDFDEVQNATWLPYISFQLNFLDNEKEYLLRSLSDVVMDAGDLIDLTGVLNASADKIFQIASSSLSHCDNFTGYLSINQLVMALEDFFTAYADKLARALRTVNVQYGLNNVKNQTIANMSEDQYYTLFGHSFRIIGTSGKLLQLFTDFEQKLISCLLNSPYAEISMSNILDDNKKPNRKTLATNPHYSLYKYLKAYDPKIYNTYQELIVTLKQESSSNRNLLPKLKNLFVNTNQQVHQLAFDIAFAQIKSELMLIPSLEIWNVIDDKQNEALVDKNELPAFSLSPTECATKVGQYLMTLPQHLEPLTVGLSETSGEQLNALETALHTAKLPYSGVNENQTDENIDLHSMADQWLSSIVCASEHTYVEAALQIPELSSNGARQLAVDLEYMGNVISALGLPVLSNVTSLTKLLRLSKDDYLTEAFVDEIPKRLAKSISKIRKLGA